MKKLCLLLVLSVLSSGIKAQYFEHVYGGTFSQRARGACRTVINQGVCIVGAETGRVQGPGITLSHSDLNGILSSANDFNLTIVVNGVDGKPLTAAGVGVAEFDDGTNKGYGIIGTLRGANISQMFLMIVDMSGAVQSFVPFDYTNYTNEQPNAIIYNKQIKKFVFVGTLTPNNIGTTDIFISQMDFLGNISTSVFDLHPLGCAYLLSNDEAYDLIQDPYSGQSEYYYVVGRSSDHNQQLHGFLLGVDFTNLLSSTVQMYHLGALLSVYAKHAEFYTISSSPSQNGFVVGGAVKDNNSDQLVTVLKPNGAIVWYRIMDHSLAGGADNASGKVIESQQGPGYIASGFVTNGPIGGWDSYTLKFDMAGNPITNSEITHGTTSTDYPVNFWEENGQGLYMPSATNHYSGFDHALLHTDQNGLLNPLYSGTCVDLVSNPVEATYVDGLGHYVGGLTQDNFDITITDYPLYTLVAYTNSDNEICTSLPVVHPPQYKGVTTGISKFSSNDNSLLSAYPNPFSNSINLEFNESEIEGSVKIEVYNVIGQAVTSITGDSNRLTLKTEGWPSGVYTIKVSSPVGTISTIKVIKAE